MPWIPQVRLALEHRERVTEIIGREHREDDDVRRVSHTVFAEDQVLLSRPERADPEIQDLDGATRRGQTALDACHKCLLERYLQRLGDGIPEHDDAPRAGRLRRRTLTVAEPVGIDAHTDVELARDPAPFTSRDVVNASAAGIRPQEFVRHHHEPTRASLEDADARRERQDDDADDVRKSPGPPAIVYLTIPPILSRRPTSTLPSPTKLPRARARSPVSRFATPSRR